MTYRTFDGTSQTETITDGRFSSDGTQYIADLEKINIGTGNDLQIYHDSNSYIKDAGDGYLQISTNGSGVYLVKSDGSSLASFITDASCELFEAGNKKFETTGDGVELSNAANNKVDLKFHFGSNSGYSIIQMDNANNLILDCDPTEAGADSFIQFKVDGSEVLKLDKSAGTTITSPAHDGGLKVVAGNNNQETRIELQGKASNGTAHDWHLAASRSSDKFYISNGSSTHFAILDGGECLFGHASSIDTSTFHSKIQVMGSTADTSSIAVGRFSDDASSPSIHLTKSRNGTVGNHGSGDLHDNDIVGNIFWWGSDGGDYEEVARIGAEAGGAFTGSSTPGELTFWTTAVDATTATERLRINSAGNVGIGTANPVQLLNVHSGSSSGALLVQSNSATNYFAAVQSADDYVAGATVGSLAIRSASGIYFSANGGTNHLDIASTGVATFAGNIKMAASKGIQFSAYDEDTTDGNNISSNTLDDYEEGTWTFGIQYHNGSAWVNGGYDAAPANTTGSYIKVGRIVHITIYTGVFNVNAATVSNSARISGLPFNNTSAAEQYNVLTIAHGDTFTNSAAAGYVEVNSNTVRPTVPGGIATDTWKDGNVYMMMTGTYITD